MGIQIRFDNGSFIENKALSCAVFTEMNKTKSKADKSYTFNGRSVEIHTLTFNLAFDKISSFFRWLILGETTLPEAIAHQFLMKTNPEYKINFEKASKQVAYDLESIMKNADTEKENVFKSIKTLSAKKLFNQIYNKTIEHFQKATFFQTKKEDLLKSNLSEKNKIKYKSLNTRENKKQGLDELLTDHSFNQEYHQAAHKIALFLAKRESDLEDLAKKYAPSETVNFKDRYNKAIQEIKDSSFLNNMTLFLSLSKFLHPTNQNKLQHVSSKKYLEELMGNVAFKEDFEKAIQLAAIDYAKQKEYLSRQHWNYIPAVESTYLPQKSGKFSDFEGGNSWL